MFTYLGIIVALLRRLVSQTRTAPPRLETFCFSFSEEMLRRRENPETWTFLNSDDDAQNDRQHETVGNCVWQQEMSRA